MKQHYTDERTGIGYTLQGDYYLPDIACPTKKSSLLVYGENTVEVPQNTSQSFIIETKNLVSTPFSSKSVGIIKK